MPGRFYFNNKNRKIRKVGTGPSIPPVRNDRHDAKTVSKNRDKDDSAEINFEEIQIEMTV